MTRDDGVFDVHFAAYSTVPFIPYFIGAYIALAREDFGLGISIILIWFVVDITIVLYGKDPTIIWGGV